MDDEDQSMREALLGNLGTELARHRTQVTVGQLEPGLGERIG
jgi:ribosomal protein L29